MKIFVHSKGRASLKTGTLSWLQPVWKDVVIVCPATEVDLYRIHWPKVLIYQVPVTYDLPEVQNAIARRFVTDRKFVMMDDDLRFAYRPDPAVPALLQAFEQIPYMMRQIEILLDAVAHVTICPRQGNNRVDAPITYVTAARSVLAYRRDVLERHDVLFNRSPSKSDYDATLQLFRLGYRNACINIYTHDQVGGPTLAGGCTESRTESVHERASTRLSELHPGFVKVVVKQKPDWKFPRHDVIVSWKKAYESADKVRTPPLFIKRSSP